MPRLHTFRNRSTALIVSAAALLLVSNAARAQPPVENPPRTPGLALTKPPLKPKLVSITIVQLGKTPPACLKPGVDYRVTGERLTSTTTAARGISIAGHGAHVKLRTLNWTDTGVTIRLPLNSALDHTKSYYMAVTDGGQWASDLTFRKPLCAPDA